MNIDESVILKLEKLAKLNLSQAERKEMQTDLGKMLGMVDKLSKVDTEGVEPLVYMHEQKNIVRPDDQIAAIDRREALQNAPVSEGMFFAVPRIIDK